jgi:hypothetical protein
MCSTVGRSNVGMEREESCASPTGIRSSTTCQLYADALAEYLRRHGPEEVTAAMNEVMDRLGESHVDPFVAAAARRTLAIDRELLTERVGRLSAQRLAQMLDGVDVVLGR